MKLLTDWMFARIFQEHFLKVRTANGQHDLVRLEELPVARDGHIDQVAPVVQTLEPARDIVRKVVPTERKFVHFSREDEKKSFFCFYHTSTHKY